ncbi:MAG: hypothetical protein IJ568_05210 [Bacilli bacterium]|nr:hypothetical protein [Bacilli bacterium]
MDTKNDEFSEKEQELISLLDKEKSLTQVCSNLELNKYEILGLVSSIRGKGQNIIVKRLDDDIYLINHGEREIKDKNSFSLNTDNNHEFKFVAFSDTRLGSKSEQLSILNDIYRKAHEMGYNNAILCGNISAGLYPITDIYAETNFIDDTYQQVDYIKDNYPYVEGMKTYFITGKVDDTHLKKNKVNIGKRISQVRSDMIYLGDNSCDVFIDNVRMQVLCSKLGKTYTVSYRTQQQVDSFRSEDKPDILLHGGLLQMEKFTDRSVKTISVPSVVATTKEMNDKRYSNTIGAWFVTVKTDNKGNLLSVRAFNSPYYVTKKDDYHSAKPLKLVKKKETN